MGQFTSKAFLLMICQDGAKRGIKEIDRTEKGTEKGGRCGSKPKRFILICWIFFFLSPINNNSHQIILSTLEMQWPSLQLCLSAIELTLHKTRQFSCRLNVSTVCQDLCETLVVCGVIQVKLQDFNLNQVPVFLRPFVHLVMMVNFTAS